MKKMVMVGVVISLTGCALFMSPEERQARRERRAMESAMSMAPVSLCYAILLRDDTPQQYSQAAEQRGINCASPEMVELVKAKQQANISTQAANREAYRNLQNIGTSILQQNQANRPRPLTNCMMVGNMMSCY